MIMNVAHHERFVSLITRDTLALVLAGGRGKRLMHLTRHRAKPAVYFGGKFRLIDFPLSNCVNSDVRRIFVLTQYKAHSLIRHLRLGWGFLRGHLGEFVEVVPAQQRVGESWYLGTADAVYQNLDLMRRQRPKYVLILAGDHAYKMDYGPMIAAHVNAGADATVGCMVVPRKSATSLGVMTVRDDDMIIRFSEKPDDPEPVPGRDDMALASMGIYVFNAEFLDELLRKDAPSAESSHDFGNDIIPAIIDDHDILAYRFLDPSTGEQAYWRDVGTPDAFWEANLELVKVTPPLDLYDLDWPIWTYQQQLPPAKFVFDDDDRRGLAVDSLVSSGCIVSGSTVRRSVLFNSVRVNSSAEVNGAVLLPGVDIGRHCRLHNVIADRGTQIPTGTVIGEDPEEDARRFFVSRGGVTLVCPEMFED
jgi:glucose-1-phosphate adenylyltransferase